MADLVEKLYNAVEDWFYNYFTLDNFDTVDALIDALRDAKHGRSSVLADCFNSLVFDYGCGSDAVDQNYEDIIDVVYEEAVGKLGCYVA